jgi:tight adherence protein C
VILTLLVGLVLTAAAVALVARTFMLTRMRATAQLAQIGHYGFAGIVEQPATNGLRSLMDDTASMVGGLFVDRLKIFDVEQLRKQLVSAGMYRTSPRMLMGYQVLSVILLPALWIWLALAGRTANPGLTILGLLVSVGVGWLGPTFLVRSRATQRLAEIDYDMPELIDLLVVTVEAGLSLSAAIQIAGERMKGPLGDELRISLQEQRMGLPSLQALENMLTRCPTPAVRSFVRAMIQGERLGVSVGQILRSLALEMRKRRRAKAEERAQRAPIKILFPLVFMIFPAMFVVILGPAVLSVLQAFKS